MTQILLKPKSQLIEGEVYELFIADTKSIKIKSSAKEPRSLKWRVINENDIDSPIWKESPSIYSKYFQASGCGPEIWIHFRFNYFDKSKVQVKAIVKNTQTGNERTCYVSQTDQVFKIGHNMCYGELNFDEEKEYEVVFYLVDESGNISTAAKPIKFTRPDIDGWSN